MATLFQPIRRFDDHRQRRRTPSGSGRHAEPPLDQRPEVRPPRVASRNGTRTISYWFGPAGDLRRADTEPRETFGTARDASRLPGALVVPILGPTGQVEGIRVHLPEDA